MKAVILAAGIGSRLRPLTSAKPKCMVKVAGKPILQYQIDAFARAGIKDIFIIVGYEGRRVKDYCRHIKNVNIKLIDNLSYEDTNNMYSLYLARGDVAGDNFVVVNGDVVFEPELMEKLVRHADKDVVVCEAGTYNMESMKVTVNSEGYISSIGKTISKKMAYATSIDIYRFCEASSRIFFNEIHRIIKQERKLKDWTEVALDRLFQKQSLRMKPYDIGRCKWIEVDNYDDLLFGDRRLSSFDRALRGKKLVFLDLDGTVYVDDRLINGVISFLKYLMENNIDFYFLSNNSSRSKSDYVAKLQAMGIQVKAENIILSTDGTIHWLKKENVTDLYVVGTDSMKEMFVEAGFRVDSDKPKYVVLGYDTELTYEKLRKSAFFLQNGSEFLATHCDMVCPTPEGPVPDIGSMLMMFEAALGIKPLKVFGKPNRDMVAYIIEKHNVSAKEIVVIGDRIYTDMELANRLRCDFICVLSGDTKREEIEELTKPPALVVPNIGYILDGN
ncbi:MAG TPA: HAD-IIA family hydrolase [Sedimentisphaerales bacterium]|nr:HAD-IIA family hydrolase [Sedimentisphaerales bacterium]